MVRTNAQDEAVPHWGLDLGGSDAEIGTEISAIEGGTVFQVTRRDFGWGNFIIVEADSKDMFYLYAHLSKITIEGGDSIDEGDKIGEMGESGNADDAKCNSVHLHLEVREGESWPTDAESGTRDPEKYVGTEFNEEGAATSDDCSPVFKNA
jgi:murein DD-endopeptidase MepM/ murein hydrolase activator NlpD